MRLKRLRLLVPVGALLAFALALSSCGGDDNGGAGDASGDTPAEQYPPVSAAPDSAKEGGEVTVLSAGDVDYMDPGAAYYQFSYMITMAGHRTLLSWQPDDVDQPTPDLAEGEPKISEDGLTIEFTIRDGVRFSPPVDREVTAADVEYAIERAVLPGVLNGYAPVYFSDIVGWDEATKKAADDPTGGAPDLPGVTAVDDKTLRIEIDKPEIAIADVLVQALSLPISAPVPEEYAKEFDAKNPSTYGQYVTFTGPYMVQNGCVDENGKVVDENCSGELTGYTPGKEITMVRNPNWDGEATGDFRPAYLERINFQEGFTDTASASRKILNGEDQISGDFPPPKAVLKEAAQDAEEGQLQLPILPGYRHISMRTDKPPFDDINVRKAVIANSDREALRNTRGGPLVGEVAQHYISPGFPGFEEGGGHEAVGVDGQPLDFLANDRGDPELAAEYMKKAGYESGKCEGSECEVSMVGDNIAPGKDTAEVFKGQLEELGFTVNFRPVDHAIMYTRFCSVPEQEPEICPNVGVLPDFHDAQVLIAPQFAGDAIDPENNTNWPLLDDPKVNQAIDDARVVKGTEERAEAWGKVDKMVNELAPAVPWIWEYFPNIQSADVAGVINLYNGAWDLSFTSLK
jgi:peptide/nickel transport system substrate-binding protein